MKLLFIAFILCLTTSGCYTMLYPPPEELYRYSQNDSTLISIPDSIRDINITIINENQIIMDRYSRYPGYYRDDWYGGYGYWDPYYYNPRSYYREHRWRHGHYRSYYPGGSMPQPKKARRTKNYRRSESSDPPESNQKPHAADKTDSSGKPTAKTNKQIIDNTDQAAAESKKPEDKSAEKTGVENPGKSNPDLNSDESKRNGRPLRDAQPGNVKNNNEQDRQDEIKDDNKKQRRDRERKR